MKRQTMLEQGKNPVTQHFHLKSYLVLYEALTVCWVPHSASHLPYLILTISPVSGNHYYPQFTHRPIIAQTLDYISQPPLPLEVTTD